MTFSDCVKAKIKELVGEGRPRDQAVAMAYKHCKKTKDGISVARIVKAGPYLYDEDGKAVIRWKKFEDLKKAYDENDVHVLLDGHEGEPIGIVYDYHKDEAEQSVFGKVYPPLPEGSGVSAGFDCLEVRCDEGICQKELKIDHVAGHVIPRGSDNVVIVGDGNKMTDEKILAEMEELRKRVDGLSSLEAKIDKLVARDDAIEEEKKRADEGKRLALVEELKMVKWLDGTKLDTMCTHDLELLKVTVEKVPVPKGGAQDGVKVNDGYMVIDGLRVKRIGSEL